MNNKQQIEQTLLASPFPEDVRMKAVAILNDPTKNDSEIKLEILMLLGNVMEAGIINSATDEEKAKLADIQAQFETDLAEIDAEEDQVTREVEEVLGEIDTIAEELEK